MAITKATQGVIDPNICTTDTAQTITGEKTFTQAIIADVTGDVAGNLTGNVTGNVTGDVTATSVSTTNLVNGSSLCFRNKIINGNFDIWQRGTSLASGTAFRLLADRFSNNSIGSTYTASQQLFTNGQTDVPNNPSYFHRTVVSSVAGNNNFCLLQQRVESVKTLAGQTATISFYAKADSNKSISVNFSQAFGTGGSPAVELPGSKLNLTASWQKFTVTVNIPSVNTKIITGGNDLIVARFWFDAGSDYDLQTNSLGQQSGTFDIAQVQLEEGSVATPFENRPIGTELALCQRYYQAFTAGVTFTTSSYPYEPFIYSFPVTMRSIPTITNQNINTPIVNVNGIFATGAIGSNASTPTNSNFTASAEL